MLLQLKIMFSILIYFKMPFIPVMENLHFQHYSSVFNVTRSFRNHSDADSVLKKHLLLSIIVLLNICVETVIHFSRSYQ